MDDVGNSNNQNDDSYSYKNQDHNDKKPSSVDVIEANEGCFQMKHQLSLAPAIMTEHNDQQHDPNEKAKLNSEEKSQSDNHDGKNKGNDNNNCSFQHASNQAPMPPPVVNRHRSSTRRSDPEKVDKFRTSHHYGETHKPGAIAVPGALSEVTPHHDGTNHHVGNHNDGEEEVEGESKQEIEADSPNNNPTEQHNKNNDYAIKSSLQTTTTAAAAAPTATRISSSRRFDPEKHEKITTVRRAHGRAPPANLLNKSNNAINTEGSENQQSLTPIPSLPGAVAVAGIGEPTNNSSNQEEYQPPPPATINNTNFEPHVTVSSENIMANTSDTDPIKAVVVDADAERERILQEAQEELRARILAEASPAEQILVTAIPDNDNEDDNDNRNKNEQSDNDNVEKQNRYLWASLFVVVIVAIIVAIVLTTKKPFTDETPDPIIIPMGNDRCPNATFIDSTLVFNNTADATWDSSLLVDCNGALSTTQGYRGLWYKLTGSGLPMYASTCQRAAFDTQIAIFTGTCENLQCVAGNDNSIEIGCGQQSSVTWPTSENQTYYLLIFGASSKQRDVATEGEFALGLQTTVENDLCETAMVIDTNIFVMNATNEAIEIMGDITMATLESPPICNFESTGRGVWYMLNGTDSVLSASTCNGANFNSQISIFQGTSCSTLSCVDANDDACGTQSSVTWFATQGETYYILVHGVDQSSGNFKLTIRETAENDICETATEIDIPVNDETLSLLSSSSSSSVTLFGDTMLASFDKDITNCQTGLDVAQGLYYEINGTGNVLSVSLCESDAVSSSSLPLPPPSPSTLLSHQLNVFSGVCGFLDCFTIGQYDHSCGRDSSFHWRSNKYETYLIHVSKNIVRGGNNNNADDFVLTLTETTVGVTCDLPIWPLGPQDRFLTRSDFYLPNGGNPVALPSCNVASASATTNTSMVWYSIIGQGTNILVSTCSVEEDKIYPLVSIYTGTSCNELECVDSIWDYSKCSNGGGGIDVQWFGAMGKEYYIVVHADLGANYDLLIVEDSTTGDTQAPAGAPIEQPTPDKEQPTDSSAAVDSSAATNSCWLLLSLLVIILLSLEIFLCL